MRKKIPEEYRELRRKLIKALDANLEKELEKLKGYSAGSESNGGAAYLLVKAGLLEYSCDMGSTFHSDYCFDPTEKGKEIYNNIINQGAIK